MCLPPSIGAAAGETAGEEEDAACAAAGGFDEAAGASVRGAAATWQSEWHLGLHDSMTHNSAQHHILVLLGGKWLLVGKFATAPE